MSTTSALATQQLAEFLAFVATFPDAHSATRGAVERAARALDAEVAAVVGADGVQAAIGFPAGRIPATELAEIAAGSRTVLAVPGAGPCTVAVGHIGGAEPRQLVLARSGADGFTVDEVSLIRGMARVIELTVATHRTLAAERRQAVENAHLLATLQERQRLMEQLSAIQRAITRREPLRRVLDTITGGAQELFSDDVVALHLLDPDDPGMLVLASSSGLPAETTRRHLRLAMADAGVIGQAIERGELIVSEPGPGPAGRPSAVRMSMAAPVYENGTVVGTLVVGSTRADRVFTKTDQEVLLAFAEHVSLAVTDAKTVEAMYQAFHDSLTGLASRALFLDRLTYALACAQRDHTGVALLFIDLDRFKNVNDSLGHAAGDALLVGVANRLRESLRTSDTAARFGGDEFAALLHNVSAIEQATIVADRIIQELRQPFQINGKEVFIDSSIGIAFSDPAEPDAETLMQHADRAMYQAKRNGKGRYEIFAAADPRPGRQTSLDVETDLRRAVRRSEFVLRYQPIVDLASGRVHGLEALVRWEHPERGLIPPLDFIPLAEETGLIVEIGQWVLAQACRQTSAWNARRGDRPPLTVSVNLSARQLAQPDLTELVAGTLAETGLAPDRLVLELTESLLAHDAEVSAARLGQLKDLGIRVAVDDFGTGYSALSYLRRFPVDTLKIDKSFVDDMGTDPTASALTLGIIRLGQTLGLTTVAEGIETALQRDLLRGGGCALGQGYHFAKPLAGDEVEALLGLSG